MIGFVEKLEVMLGKKGVQQKGVNDPGADRKVKMSRAKEVLDNISPQAFTKKTGKRFLVICCPKPLLREQVSTQVFAKPYPLLQISPTNVTAQSMRPVVSLRDFCSRNNFETQPWPKNGIALTGRRYYYG